MEIKEYWECNECKTMWLLHTGKCPCGSDMRSNSTKRKIVSYYVKSLEGDRANILKKYRNLQKMYKEIHKRLPKKYK